MENKSGLHCLISGKVQGVWFRASTQEKAVALGLTGWARNLHDGRVEVMAFGDTQLLDQLLAWLKQGPPLARVDDVLVEKVTWQEHARFAVK